MPRPDKVEAVKQIASDLKSCDVYYIVDYRGLTYSESAELRRRLVKVDATLKVVKNTLAKRAATEAGVDGLEALLQGPTAIVYAKGDAVQTAKTIQDFIRENKKISVRGGKLESTMLAASDVETLATLPSREQLIARLVGTLAAPLSGLVTVLNGPIRQLVIVVGQIEQKANAA